MKIGFIINSLATGGAEKQTVALINALSKEHDVILFLLKDKMNLYETVSKNITIYNLRGKKYLDLNSIKKIKSVLEQENVRIIFTVNSYSCFMGYLASLKMNIIKVFINHTTRITSAKERIQNIYYRKIINTMDYRIFVSLNQKNYWLNNYKIVNKNNLVINNGISNKLYDARLFNDSELEQLKEKYNICIDDFVILQCAILRPEKNHIELLIAVRNLINRGYDKIKVLLIGDGIERERLENYINKNKLRNNVFLAGLQNDVRPYYSMADLGTLTSISETFSIAALEQLSMGIPMVMPNVGGSNEMIIDGYNGFLYESKNTEELTKIIEKCCANKWKVKAMSVNAINVVNSLFTTDKMIEKYSSFITNITKVI